MMDDTDHSWIDEFITQDQRIKQLQHDNIRMREENALLMHTIELLLQKMNIVPFRINITLSECVARHVKTLSMETYVRENGRSKDAVVQYLVHVLIGTDRAYVPCIITHNKYVAYKQKNIGSVLVTSIHDFVQKTYVLVTHNVRMLIENKNWTLHDDPVIEFINLLMNRTEFEALFMKTLTIYKRT
jgi:uncharacterized damage-inducible protein DinB